MDFQLPISLINWLLFALLAAGVALTALSFRPVVNYIKAHVQGKVFELLRKYSYNYVAALEQDPTLNGLASEEKKQLAVLWLMTTAEKLHFALTEPAASNLVEEAVY